MLPGLKGRPRLRDAPSQSALPSVLVTSRVSVTVHSPLLLTGSQSLRVRPNQSALRAAGRGQRVGVGERRRCESPGSGPAGRPRRAIRPRAPGGGRTACQTSSFPGAAGEQRGSLSRVSGARVSRPRGVCHPVGLAPGQGLVRSGAASFPERRGWATGCESLRTGALRGPLLSRLGLVSVASCPCPSELDILRA